MIRAFQILAVALILAAAYFFIQAEYDDAFVMGVLGACSFFLSVRFTFKPRVQARLEGRRQAASNDAEEQADAENEQQ